jgi:hypothetical protein
MRVTVAVGAIRRVRQEWSGNGGYQAAEKAAPRQVRVVHLWSLIFHLSSLIFHLPCFRFRAIECRRLPVFLRAVFISA